MQQEATITIDKDHISVERIQIACGREIRVVSVFPRQGKCTPMDKLKTLVELDYQQKQRSA